MISVIIPARDASDTLGACLEAVRAQRSLEISPEVIVVDDGSKDETAQIAERHGVRLVRLPGEGPAAARNAGARAARGEILAFTDADCAPGIDWLTQLTRPFEDPHVVGVKGAYRTQQSGLVPLFVQAEYEHKYERLARQTSIDFIDTYSAAYRRDIFLQNGGFDPSFPVPSVEDQEFSFRLARKGYHMVFAPHAIVEHQHDKSLREYLRRKFGIGYWKAYMLRWLPEKALSDSHTPASLRWQIALLGLAVVGGLLGLRWAVAGWLALASLGLFYLTALPFLRKIRAEAPGVLMAAPVLLLVRAAALGTGLVAGFVSPPSTTARRAGGLSLGHRAAKRVLDVVGASFGLVLSAPLVALAAVAIKLDGSGPVFFTQERAGENGKPFRMIKLRTMVVGAEKQVGQVLAANPLSGPVFKIPNDPRVTRVGRVLRRWSLDEIPQLWNVLRGEMSLVGPRPEECWVVAQYDDRQRARLAVKPGLTGPMQVGGRGSLDMEQRLALEMDYIENCSLWKDLAILSRSIPAVLSGRGAI
jgi:lipopolysaccharide/colanic/teichoic acid biosynthesis glycosyltransferase/GT2 family glycosyltransferase